MLTGAHASRAGPAASAPAPAAGGWGAAFLAQNSAAAGQAQAAVQAEVDKRKGARPRGPRRIRVRSGWLWGAR